MSPLSAVRAWWRTVYGPDPTPEECRRRRMRGGWHADALATSCAFPVSAWNAYTNLAYPAAGALLLWRVGGPAAWAITLCLTGLGIGSLLYHAYKTVASADLDWVGMFLVFTGFITLGLMAHLPHLILPVTGLGSALASFLLVYAFKQRGANFLIGVLFAIALVPLLFSPGRWYALAALATFGVAKRVWTLDKRHDPRLATRGHGYWHILTAEAFALLFLAHVTLTETLV